MQTEPMADESKKGHSGGARDMPVCSGSADAVLNPLSCGWRAVGQPGWAQSVRVLVADGLWSAQGRAF